MMTTVNLFPNTGHHLYFMPLAIPPQAQAQEATAEAFLRRKKIQLPSLTPEMKAHLLRLCTSAPDWIQAKGKGSARDSERTSLPWLRGKFGTKSERVSPAEPTFELQGIWCAIETNTGTRQDGYVWDVDRQPAANDSGWQEWQRNPDHSTPYFPEAGINYNDPLIVDLAEAFELKGKLGEPVEPCKLEIRWQKPGGSGPIPVHLIIDFGNSRTIVYGLEIPDPPAPGGLRDICRPILFTANHDDAGSGGYRNSAPSELVPDSWIILREPMFSGEDFIPPHFSWSDYISEPNEATGVARLFSKVAGGGAHQKHKLVRIIKRVPHMFIELSPALIGPEAASVLARANVRPNHLTFLSSPKRYAWDDDPVGRGLLSYWFMHPRTGQGTTRWLGGEMFRFLPRSPHLRRFIIEEKNPAPPTEWEDERLKPPPYPEPDFGRADALIWTALAVIERASRQIQSEAWRSNSPMPHYIDQIMVTFPPGWTDDEYTAYWNAWYLATEIYYWSHGSNKSGSSRPFTCPGLSMSLDEAIASQLAVVFSEIHHLNDRSRDWIELYGRIRGNGRSVRVLAIDIGGGTLDTAVVEYRDKGLGGAGVHLVSEVLFNDSSTVAGDKLVKDLIEGILLPRLGKQFQQEPNKKAIFEKALGSSSQGISAGEDRLRRMVITRTVFVPMIFKWLEDCTHGRTQNPQTKKPWSPHECGANPVQIEELNNIFREAGLSGVDERVLDPESPFEIDYQRMNEIIDDWCRPIARLHARYVAALKCDVVIVTGKPSELPQIQLTLNDRLPIESDRIIFASGYYAGNWFPGTSSGKIPDAKMVTVVGAALYQAIENNLIHNWHIDEIVNRYGAPRNYWGVASHLATPFHEDDILLRPEDEQVEKPLGTNLIIGRARFLQNCPESVYILRWRDQQTRLQRGNRLVKVRIRRVTKAADGKPLRTEHLKLVWVDARDSTGETVSLDQLELHLRTLPQDEGHWLDKGQFAVRWG
jgi:hypothetical protein